MNKKQTLKIISHYDGVFHLPEGLMESVSKFLKKEDKVKLDVYYDFEQNDNLSTKVIPTVRVQLESDNGVLSFGGIGYKPKRY